MNKTIHRSVSYDCGWWTVDCRDGYVRIRSKLDHAMIPKHETQNVINSLKDMIFALEELKNDKAY